MGKSKNKYAVLGAALAILLLSFPAFAFAADEGGLAGFVTGITLGAVLDVIGGLVALVRDMLLQMITWLGSALQAVINLKLSTGGSPVYTAWRILRDVCNMMFIIALIFMSFGTIFNAFALPFLKAFSIRSKGVIAGFLIGALALNFSLAIGQVVMLVSNQLSTIVLAVFPKDLGASLVQAVDLTKTQLGPKTAAGLTALAIPDNVPTEGLTPRQKQMLSQLGPTVQRLYSECLKDNKDTTKNCYTRVVLPVLENQQITSEIVRDAGRSNFSLNIAENVKCLTGQSCAPIVVQDNGTKFRMIFTNLWLTFLALVFLISLLLPFLFSVVRIPAIWVILALSPLAWTSKAFQQEKGFSEWWRQFMAWNIFTPLYLFVILLGMVLVQKNGEMIYSLQTADGTVPLITGFLSEIFGYGMVALVFIGGTALVMKLSFQGSSYALDAATSISSKLGMDSKYGALKPAARLTGIPARVQARKEQVAAKLGELRRRLPLKTYDERLEAQRLRLGLITGRAAADLRAKPITDERKRMADATYGMAPADRKKHLTDRMNSSNKTVALAAREELLEMGELQKMPGEVAKTRDMYPPGAAQAAFDERSKKAAGTAARAKKKEEEEGKEAIITDISSRDYPDAASVATALAAFDPARDKPGYDAAVEGIRRKAPKQLLDHLSAGGPPTQQNIVNAFEAVLRDPKKIADLPPSYLDSTNRSGGNRELKQALNIFYGLPAPAGGPPNKRRNDAKDKLIDANPRKVLEIEKLFSLL